jgi:hypothetical protein
MRLGAMGLLLTLFEPADVLGLRQPHNCESSGSITADDLGDALVTRMHQPIVPDRGGAN